MSRMNTYTPNMRLQDALQLTYRETRLDGINCSDMFLKSTVSTVCVCACVCYRFPSGRKERHQMSDPGLWWDGSCDRPLPSSPESIRMSPQSQSAPREWVCSHVTHHFLRTLDTFPPFTAVQYKQNKYN